MLSAGRPCAVTSALLAVDRVTLFSGNDLRIDDFSFLFDDCGKRHREGHPFSTNDAFVMTIAAS
jgi:hypothetical protein